MKCSLEQIKVCRFVTSQNRIMSWKSVLGEIQKRPKSPIVVHAQFGTKPLSLVCFLAFKQDVTCGVHPMPYIMYSKFQRFICFILDFMMFFVLLEQNFTHPKWWNLCFFVPKLLIFEPCLWGFCVPTSSPNRVVFKRITYLFRTQLVPFSIPDRASFEPKKIFFRAQIVPISCPNRASFEPCSCCYRALFVLLSSPFPAVSILSTCC